MLKQPIISFSIEQQAIGCGRSIIKISLNKIELNSGNYSIVMGFVEKKTKKVLFRLENICPFYVKNKETLWGKILTYTSLEVKSL